MRREREKKKLEIGGGGVLREAKNIVCAIIITERLKRNNTIH